MSSTPPEDLVGSPEYQARLRAAHRQAYEGATEEERAKMLCLPWVREALAEVLT